MTDEKNQSIYNLIYLVGCAVTGTATDPERVSKMDLQKVYHASSRHMMTALVWEAIKNSPIADNELMEKFSKKSVKAARKNLLLDTERARLCAYLDTLGVWRIPLKGVVLKELYPKQEMRQMSDNDILFDRAFEEEVHKWFLGEGYEVVVYRRTNHNTYKKEPIYNFEMHTALMGASADERWQRYYENVKERLVKDDSGEYGYHFTDDDFYIYITTHAYKHYSNRGTGLRSLLDTFVYLNVKGDTLNFDYIQAECEKLGIAEFESAQRSLTKRVFSQPDSFSPDDLSEAVAEMLSYFAFSGTYGTQANHVENALKGIGGKNAKMKYMISRLFPPMEFYKNHYPKIYKSKILIPFFCVYRILRIPFKGAKRIWNELGHVLRSKANKTE